MAPTLKSFDVLNYGMFYRVYLLTPAPTSLIHIARSPYRRVTPVPSSSRVFLSTIALLASNQCAWLKSMWWWHCLRRPSFDRHRDGAYHALRHSCACVASGAVPWSRSKQRPSCLATPFTAAGKGEVHEREDSVIVWC